MTKENPTDLVSNLLGEYLLKGYTMLGESCQTCEVVPLMREKSGREFCVRCIQKPMAVSDQIKTVDQVKTADQVKTVDQVRTRPIPANAPVAAAAPLSASPAEKHVHFQEPPSKSKKEQRLLKQSLEELSDLLTNKDYPDLFECKSISDTCRLRVKTFLVLQGALQCKIDPDIVQQSIHAIISTISSIMKIKTHKDSEQCKFQIIKSLAKDIAALRRFCD